MAGQHGCHDWLWDRAAVLRFSLLSEPQIADNSQLDVVKFESTYEREKVDYLLCTSFSLKNVFEKEISRYTKHTLSI